MIVLSLVVQAVDVGKSGVNLWIDIGVLLYLTLDVGEHLVAIVVETQVVLLLSLRN